MMRTKRIILLLGIFAQISAAAEIKILAEPTTIHQLFKSCKKDKALYTCALTGKMIVTILDKTRSAFISPTLEDNAHYNIYWWPNACTPAEHLKMPSNCLFNLLFQKKSEAL